MITVTFEVDADGVVADPCYISLRRKDGRKVSSVVLHAGQIVIDKMDGAPIGVEILGFDLCPGVQEAMQTILDFAKEVSAK